MLRQDIRRGLDSVGNHPPDGHGEEFIHSVSVVFYGRLVHCQEAQRFRIDGPHGLWIGVKQQSVLFRRSPQLPFRQVALHDFAQRTSQELQSAHITGGERVRTRVQDLQNARYFFACS